MKFNKWTHGLAAMGVISLASAAQAEEALHPVMTTLQSTTISGYVDTSAIWQFGNGNMLPGRSFDGGDKSDGFNLNVVKLQLEKPLDESQWSAGYRVGLMFGPDANAVNTASSPLGVNSSDLAVKNAYVNMRAPIGNGLEIKMGVWDTIVGYEVMEAGNNPNYSRSYGFFIEPIVHTGILASYKVNDVLSLSAGVADRGDINNVNARSGMETLKSYLGSITLTAPESAGALKGASLYSGIIDSGIANGKDIMNLYVGASVPTPAEGLSVGAAYDYRANALRDSSYENAVGGYLSYQATEKLKLNGRVEYATSSRGGYGTSTGESVELLGVTGTVDYNLWANAITRLEFRWDTALSGPGLFNGGTSAAEYDDNALSVALNVIYKF
jgi:hypothetical protein